MKIFCLKRLKKFFRFDQVFCTKHFQMQISLRSIVFLSRMSYYLATINIINYDVDKKHEIGIFDNANIINVVNNTHKANKKQ